MSENEAGTQEAERLAALEAQVAEFRSNNISLLKERDTLSAELEQYRTTAAEAAAEAERKAAEAIAASTDAEQVREAMSAKIAELTEKSEGRVSALTGQLDKLLLEQSAHRALDEHGFIADLAMPHVKARVEMREIEGQRVAVVLDDNGGPRVNDDGTYMGVSALVESMKGNEKFQALQRPTAANGGGAANAGAGGITVKSKAALGDSKAKAEFIDKHGFEAFAALPVQ